jgi:hypothetical protein
VMTEAELGEAFGILDDVLGKLEISPAPNR